MNRAVFDTNVVVSGFLSPAGPPGRIVEWMRNGSVRAVLDDRIMAEYAEVLARPVFRLPVAEVELVLAAIRGGFGLRLRRPARCAACRTRMTRRFWNVLWRPACRWSRATSAIFQVGGEKRNRDYSRTVRRAF